MKRLISCALNAGLSNRFLMARIFGGMAYSFYRLGSDYLKLSECGRLSVFLITPALKERGIGQFQGFVSGFTNLQVSKAKGTYDNLNDGENIREREFCNKPLLNVLDEMDSEEIMWGMYGDIRKKLEFEANGARYIISEDHRVCKSENLVDLFDYKLTIANYIACISFIGIAIKTLISPISPKTECVILGGSLSAAIIMCGIKLPSFRSLSVEKSEIGNETAIQ